MIGIESMNLMVPMIGLGIKKKRWKGLKYIPNIRVLMDLGLEISEIYIGNRVEINLKKPKI